MKRIITKLFAAIFALAAFLTAAGAVYLCAEGLDRPPVLLAPAADARNTAAAFLDAICAGDYETAQSHLLGTPELGADRPSDTEFGGIVWDAFVESMSYTLQGESFISDTGIAQEVTLHFLDIDATTAGLRVRAEALLAALQRNAEDVSELYAPDGGYREDVVMEVVKTAVGQVLTEDAAMTTVSLTLELTCINGTWWVLPDEGLLQAISGGLAG